MSFYMKGAFWLKFYKQTNVFEEALNRIRYLFDEFEEVWVSYSGGKDSTVIYQLALQVAREKNRLPLKVMFLDQEAEYQATIDIVKTIMYHPDVDPYWIQVPIRLFNATSKESDWLDCWSEGREWMREKDPISYKENIWGSDRFHEFYERFFAKEANGKKHCSLTGVRAEENPNRFTGLTGAATYKGLTWGKKNPYSKTTLKFHPIYDWSYLDIWKAIHENKWEYNKIYDHQYSYGVDVLNMRVSNLHHETAVKHLFMLQEIEPETYQKLTKRLGGVDTAAKLGNDNYYIKKLPFMFKDWVEYRDYLLEHLIPEQVHRDSFKKQFAASEAKYAEAVGVERMARMHIRAILANDYHGTKIANESARWRNIKKDYERRIEREQLKGSV